MKQSLLLTFIILSLSVLGLQAQELLTIEPIPVEKTFVEDLSNENLSLKVTATITNNSDEEVSLKWVRSAVEKPEAWRSQVCDNNLCYEAPVFTNINPAIGLNAPAVMEANSSFIIQFYVLPMGEPGFGEFELAFSTVDSPDEILQTAVFKVTVESLTSTREETKANLRVYPNPTTDFIELSGNNSLVDQLVVYNLIGRRVKTFNVVNGSRYDVRDLPTGMYLVSLVNRQEGVLKTLRMSKRTVRP